MNFVKNSKSKQYFYELKLWWDDSLYQYQHNFPTVTERFPKHLLKWFVLNFYYCQNVLFSLTKTNWNKSQVHVIVHSLKIKKKNKKKQDIFFQTTSVNLKMIKEYCFISTEVSLWICVTFNFLTLQDFLIQPARNFFFNLCNVHPWSLFGGLSKWIINWILWNILKQLTLNCLLPRFTIPPSLTFFQ